MTLRLTICGRCSHLRRPSRLSLNTLVLGCTHFPDAGGVRFAAPVGAEVRIVDSAAHNGRKWSMRSYVRRGPGENRWGEQGRCACSRPDGGRAICESGQVGSSSEPLPPDEVELVDL